MDLKKQKDVLARTIRNQMKEIDKLKAENEKLKKIASEFSYYGTAEVMDDDYYRLEKELSELLKEK